MARAAVSQGEFRTFVEDSGYSREECWSTSGWQWRLEFNVQGPLYWRREGKNFSRRVFDSWVPLEEHQAMVHVSWYEAEAYCRWAGRRLPTEAEWEFAAGGLEKRRYPWGDEPDAQRANLDGRWGGPLSVNALPQGETPEGCRQMMGNVWEWTASDFMAYPGFVPDPYSEYSEPWFGDHKVLRGGCWATRFRLLRNTLRNFYTPDRRDVWTGFRTCRDLG
jgi:iron(II)-dependent oxidoreductase